MRLVMMLTMMLEPELAMGFEKISFPPPGPSTAESEASGHSFEHG